MAALKNIIILPALVVAACVGFTARAEAQAQGPQCGPRADIVKQLADGFQERPVAGGVAGGGAAVFEVLASPEGASWTLLYSMPSGVSCLIATGENWQDIPVAHALGRAT